jgi:spoIIIJ-associated protein
MRSIEISARTVAEATRLALEQLGVDEDDVMIAVLQSGDEDNEALVRVSVDDGEETPQPAPATREPARSRPPLDPEKTGAYARQVLEGILERMGLEAFVTVQHKSAPGPDGEPQQSIMLYVEGLDEETVGLMIGRRGETLRSLQFLLNTIVNRTAGRWPQLVIDVGNYRQRRQESLEALARRMAEQVRSSRRPLPLEPMQSYDRRIIHMALREDTTVYTESTGEGENRRIVIFPRS